MIKQDPIEKEKYYIASFSGGKDSTAMVLRLIELGYPLDEVLCCDTTMEFPAMYRHIEKVRAVVEAAGIKFTTLKAKHDFKYYMLEYKPERKNENLAQHAGFSWPGPKARWCTGVLKKRIIDAYLRDLRKKHDIIQYIGLAADEAYRLNRENNQAADHKHPLVEWGWTEAQAMTYCRTKGYDWEGLYKIFKRVSCWCCPLQALSELRNLRRYFPELWQELKDMDAKTWRTFKERGQSVENLEKRFILEEALEAAGESITNRAFYKDLDRHLAGKITIEALLQERREKITRQITEKQIPGQQSLWS